MKPDFSCTASRRDLMSSGSASILGAGKRVAGGCVMTRVPGLAARKQRGGAELSAWRHPRKRSASFRRAHRGWRRMHGLRQVAGINLLPIVSIAADEIAASRAAID